MDIQHVEETWHLGGAALTVEMVDELRRMAMNAAELGTWAYDVESDVTYVDERGLQIINASSNYFSMDGFLEHLLPEDRHGVVDAMAGAAQSEQGQYDIEYRVEGPDGKIRWVREKGRAITEGEGDDRRPVRFIGTLMDVTQKKEAEELIAENSRRMQLLADAARRLLHGEDIRSVVIDLCSEIAKRLRCDLYLNYLYDPDLKRLCLRSWSGIPDDDVVLKALEGGCPVCGEVAKMRSPIVTDDVGRARPGPGALKMLGLKAFACHPLIARGELLGTVAFGSRKAIAFSKDDLALMRSVADQMAGAISRRRAEEALAESEARFRTIFTSSGDAIVLVDDSGTCVEANPAAGSTFWVPTETLLRSSLRELLNVEDFDEFWRRFRHEGCYAGRYSHTRNGGRMDVESYGIASIIPNRHMFVFHDITEREELLREHETQRTFLDLLIETAPTGIAVLEVPDFSFILANPQFRKITHIGESDVTGQNFCDVIGLKESAFYFLQRTYVKGEAVTLTKRQTMLGPGRERVWWNARIVPLRGRGGEVGRLLVLLDDITQDVEARERIVESERRERLRASELWAVMEAVPAMVWFSNDPKCETMTGNKASYDLLHMRAGENISENVRGEGAQRSYRMCKNGKELSARDLPMQRAVAVNQEMRDFEFDVEFDDGRVVNLYGNAAPLHDEKGNVRGAVGVFIDISVRKKYEERLQSLADELARSNLELEQFAYVASHDLQEPLRQVLGFSEHLGNRYREKLDSDAREFIDFIVEGAHRMQSLVQDLLAYSRAGSGRQMAEVSLDDLLEKAVQNLKSSIEETGAKIQHEALPTLVVSEMEITQVFQNLLGNAIKFRAERTPEIYVGARREGAEWLFWVRDNGIGFRQENAEVIFQVFQRLHTRDKYTGTGIGLAICKRVIESHGGRIWSESEQGVGSTFYFTLPAK